MNCHVDMTKPPPEGEGYCSTGQFDQLLGRLALDAGFLLAHDAIPSAPVSMERSSRLP